MKQVKLAVQSRNQSGRGPSRRARAAGQIPAVLYGPSGVRHLTIPYGAFLKLRKEVHGQTALVELSEEEKSPVLSIIQEIQRDARTDTFTHVDFREVSADAEITTHVAVHVNGDAIGVRIEGGLLDIVLHQVDVRALPQKLPSLIEIDVSELHAGKSITIGDLTPIEGVTFLGEKDQPVVSCIEPKGPSSSDEATVAETVA
jgi:large subunit ribosomal protein L25